MTHKSLVARCSRCCDRTLRHRHSQSASVNPHNQSTLMDSRDLFSVASTRSLGYSCSMLCAPVASGRLRRHSSASRRFLHSHSHSHAHSLSHAYSCDAAASPLCLFLRSIVDSMTLPFSSCPCASLLLCSCAPVWCFPERRRAQAVSLWTGHCFLQGCRSGSCSIGLSIGRVTFVQYSVQPLG